VNLISHKGDGISRLSRLVFEIWCGTDRHCRQTTDDRDAATETEGSHTVRERA